MIKTYLVDDKKMYEVYVAVRGPDRKLIARRRRNIKTEREAKQLEFQLHREVSELALVENSMTFGKWSQTVLARVQVRFKQSTFQNYRAYLRNWAPKEWDEMRISEFKADHFYKLLRQTDEKLSPISQHTFLKILKRIFQEALDEGLITFNPVKNVSVKVAESSKSVLNTEEVEKLLMHAKATHHRFFYVWAFAVMTGMRSGEMYALTWKDVDFERDLISVSKQWTRKDGVTGTKSRENRVVPISASLRALLLELKSEVGINTEHVLPRPMEWTHGDQAKVLREFCRMIGISEVKFHDLRATFITNLLSQGVPTVKVMSIVGHKKMDTTDIYVRLAGVNVRGATEALSYDIPTGDVGKNVLTGTFGQKS